ncbi:lamin tail domain-containing protein, partial [Candidatus Kaiserbacteria bacterium]|nr:lamin tail domain-containing protein [Candidatus Kaiserbacteria bacterium]
MKWCLLSLISLLLPYSAQAAVSISEVAWMGSSASANHEWIELHNDGSAQDVSGWTLSDGVNLSIDLTGTISQNSYAVLERTSEDSAPGTAFLVYTGALVNTGATLRLTRSDGSLVDQVSGGTDWESIGGDNATKETAQYTSSGWVTAAPTPGAGLNWTVEEDTSEDDDTETLNQEDLKKTSTVSTRKTKSSSAETVRLILPDVSLKLVVDAQSLGYVNQPISFSVKPSGIGDTLIDSLQYEWNFGDGLTSDQKEPTHI